MQNTVSSNNDEAVASQKAVTSAAVAATCAEVAANSANSEVIAAKSAAVAASSAAVALNLALNDRYPKEQNDHRKNFLVFSLSFSLSLSLLLCCFLILLLLLFQILTFFQKTRYLISLLMGLETKWLYLLEKRYQKRVVMLYSLGAFVVDVAYSFNCSVQ